MPPELSDTTMLAHEIDALMPTARREFMGKNRQALRDMAEQVHHWLNGTFVVVAVALAAVAVSVSRSHGIMFAHLSIASLLATLCGHRQAAAWIACAGFVCIEAIGLMLVVIRPADALERELVDAATAGTSLIMRAAAWFCGGCMYGLQPLHTDYKRTLGLAGLGVIVLRLLVTGIRCAEGSGPQALTTVLPRTLMPLILGYHLSHRLLEALVQLLRSLVGVNHELSHTQGSWVALRDCYSQIHVLLSALPPQVRMQYTGTDVIPNCYSTDDHNKKAPRPPKAIGTCIICQSEPPTHLYSPCGHRCVCSQCAVRWDEQGAGTCPFCATPYEHFLRVYDVS
mmetsp:Transcript_27986/g.63328  ORF Transcript_27986/g.63328 Transcript_27986/m.63328 type:complete len:340 (-) Transcript_27986:346-1365(-)